jgi:hypothetical protein
MTNPTITIFDALTGEVTEREMTQEEMKAHEAIIANNPVLPSPE